MATEVGEYAWDQMAWRVADLLSFGILVVDPSGNAQYANAPWTELTAIESSAAGKRWLDVFPAAGRHDRLGTILTRAQERAGYAADWTVPTSDDASRTLHVEGVAEITDGRLRAVVLTATDVTAERARLAALTQEAAHDQLTGLYTRGRFATFVEHALDRRLRDPERHLAVIVVDVDDLKGTNDTFGHDAGDALLKTIADRVSTAVRPGDVVARYGGDEFAVLCEDLRDDAEAEGIAERVRHAVRSKHGADGRFSASVGVAAANGHVEFEKLLADADRRMYAAKRGRARQQPPRSTTTTPEGPIGELAVAALELRSPVVAITGHAAFLRRWDDGLAADDVNRSIEVIERQAQRLDRTIQDVLDLSRLGHARSHPNVECDVVTVIAEVLEIAPPPPRVTLTTKVPPTVPVPVVIDEPRLFRAVLNLLTNAYRHGGPAVTIRVRREQAEAVIEVEDDGPGIPVGARARMFQPFARGTARRTDRTEAGGNGLGLAIAKQAVDALDGRLDHTPVDPHGSRFTLRIPTADRQPDDDVGEYA